MAQMPIKIRPGIVKELSPTMNDAGWSDGDKVRFFQGLPQAIGGWKDASAGRTFNGIARGMHVWVDLSNNINVAIGTNTRLMLWRGGQFYDITPLRRAAVLSDVFTTTIGLSTVMVTDTGHSMNTGDSVAISQADDVGGLTINGVFEATVIDPSTYTIVVVGQVASASTTGGGAGINLDYYIGAGTLSGAPDTGWGVGGWGVGTWGTPRTVTSNDPVITRDPRSWSLDNWGEDLIASPSGGPVYIWHAGAGASTRAVQITQAPSACEGVIVSQPDRHLITIGSTLGGAQDFLNINFSDRDDYTTWTALDTNQAGSLRAPGGSRLMQIVRSRGELVLLSDTTANAVRFIGSPYVFGISPLGAHCGTISKKAAVDVAGTTYWMGTDNFFRSDGRVQILQCPLRDYVFNNLKTGMKSKVFGVYVSKFNEIWWFYTDLTATENNRYVSLALTDGVWAIGTLSRTSGVDGKPLGDSGVPIMCGMDGVLYLHETGTDGNGAPIANFVESADYRYGEGDKFFFLDKVIPDFLNLSAAGVDITLKWRRYPNEPQKSKGPYHVTATTPFFNTRIRSKQQSLRIDSTGPWRLGKLTVNIQPDGSR